MFKFVTSAQASSRVSRRAALEAPQLAFEYGVVLRAQACATVFGRPLGAEPALVAHALEPQLCVAAGELHLAGTPHHFAFRDGLALRGRAIGLKPAAGLFSELVNRAHFLYLSMAPQVRVCSRLQQWFQRCVRGMPKPNWAISSR